MSQQLISASTVTISANTLTIDAPISLGKLTVADSYANVAIGGANTLGNLAGGSANVALGFGAGKALNIGGNNVFIGYDAGDTITTSTNNTFVGRNAGSGSSGTAHDNVAVGLSARVGASGDYNVSIGPNTGNATSTASRNTLLGFGVGGALTSGGYNTLGGTSAGNQITTGVANVCLGSSAAPALTTGSNNFIVAVTGGTGTGIATGSGNISICSNPGADDSNTTRIGQTQTRCFVQGISGISQTGPNVACTVNSAGQIGIGAVSLREMKDDIVAIDQQENHVKMMQVKARNYTYKAWEEKVLQHGVIIDEIKPIYPELVGQSRGEDFYVNYEQFIALLIAEVQYLSGRLDRLENV